MHQLVYSQKKMVSMVVDSDVFRIHHISEKKMYEDEDIMKTTTTTTATAVSLGISCVPFQHYTDFIVMLKNS